MSLVISRRVTSTCASRNFFCISASMGSSIPVTAGPVSRQASTSDHASLSITSERAWKIASSCVFPEARPFVEVRKISRKFRGSGWKTACAGTSTRSSFAISQPSTQGSTCPVSVSAGRMRSLGLTSRLAPVEHLEGVQPDLPVVDLRGVPLDAFHDRRDPRFLDGRPLAVVDRDRPVVRGRADAGEDGDADPVEVGDVGDPGDACGRHLGFDACEGFCERHCPLGLVVVGLLAGGNVHGVTGCSRADGTVLSMRFHVIVVYTCSSLGKRGAWGALPDARGMLVRRWWIRRQTRRCSGTPGYIISPRQRWYELWIIPIFS